MWVKKNPDLAPSFSNQTNYSLSSGPPPSTTQVAIATLDVYLPHKGSKPETSTYILRLRTCWNVCG